MIEQAIGNALKELQAERDRLESERERVEAAIAALQAATGKAAPRKRGRPAKSSSKSSKGVRGRAKTTKSSGRAPRGLLRKTLREVLGAAKAPITAAGLRDKVMATGYPYSSPQNLYVNVFQALAKDTAIKKTKRGYSLRGRASSTGASGKKLKTKASKKRPSKKTKQKTKAKTASKVA